MTEEKELELLRNEVAVWRKVAKEIIDTFDPLHPGSDHVLLKYVCMGVKQANTSLRETKEHARRASQLLIEHVGSDGPMNVDEVAERAVEYIEKLEAELVHYRRLSADNTGALIELDRRQRHHEAYTKAFSMAIERGKSAEEAHSIASKAVYSGTL